MGNNIEGRSERSLCEHRCNSGAEGRKKGFGSSRIALNVRNDNDTWLHTREISAVVETQANTGAYMEIRCHPSKSDI